MVKQKKKKTEKTDRASKAQARQPVEKAKPEKEPHRYTGWKRLSHIAYIALMILSVLIVAGYAAFHLFSAPPDVGNRTDDEDGDGVIDEIRTRPPTVTTMVTTDPETGKVIEYEAEVPGLSGKRKKEFYTFLLVGQDQTGGTSGAGNTDTMMLAAYDVPNQRLAVMSLPRDTYVRFRGNIVLLNSIYSRGGGGKNGIKRLKEEVGELTGVYPDFYVAVQWEAVGELVDAVGGVEFEIPFDMYYYDVSQHFEINLKKGYQTLNGSQAMQLIRWRQNSIGKTGKKDPRYGYADGDLGRIRTQQAFLKAILKKCLQPDVLLPRLGNYIDVFRRNVETDLTAGNMTYFGKAAIGGLDMDNVTMLTMPNTFAGQHVIPIGRELVSAVNQYFNPYQSDIQRYELDLVDSLPAASASAEPEDADPVHTPDPSESPKPSTDPDSSSAPETGVPESPGLTNDEPLPPGDVTSQPAESPKPAESAYPPGTESPDHRESEDPSPSETLRLPESEKPSEGAEPLASETPPSNTGNGTPNENAGKTESGQPIETAEAFPSAVPTHLPAEEDGPILPPNA